MAVTSFTPHRQEPVVRRRSRRSIRIGSLDPSEAPVTLLQAESAALYASGHVLFARNDTLMALPFDPDARQSTGDAFPLAEHVSTEGSRYMGASVSENGTLVYARAAYRRRSN